MIRIIDNKKIDLTDDEFEMYLNICKSYTTASHNGEDMFIDLFESGDDGVIIFLKPPSVRQTSLEVFLFLMSVMQHQHLRQMHKQIDDLCLELRKNK